MKAKCLGDTAALSFV